MGIAVIIGENHVHRLFSEGIFPHCSTICAKLLTYINCADAAVIIADNALSVQLTNSAALIVNADNDADLSPMVSQSIPIITCGRCNRNTVSISSLTEERVTLSLNRSIQTLCGICEPLEQSFTLLADIPLYDYMAGFAACIVLGIIR